MDPCVYLNPSNGVIMAVYVDDILILAPTNDLCQQTFDFLAKYFKMVNRGFPSTYLGLNITRTDRHHISIDQTGYIDRMLEKYDMTDCASERLPLHPPVKLHKSLPDDVRCDQEFYNSITGSINHLATKSRPDISFAISQLCQYNSDPSLDHLNAAFHLLRYIKGTRNFSIQYGGGDINPIGYADADFANRIEDRKSVSGYVFTLNNGMIM